MEPSMTSALKSLRYDSNKKEVLQSVLEDAIRMRTSFSMNDLKTASDFTMGKVVAMDHFIEALRDTIEYEDEQRAGEYA